MIFYSHHMQDACATLNYKLGEGQFGDEVVS